MPQFDPHVAVPQIVWLIAVFAVLYLIVRAALPKVERVVASRASVIGGDLAAAEIAKASAATTIADYETRLASARSDAARLAADAKAASAAETATRLKGVEADLGDRTAVTMARIEAARTEAHTSLRGVAEEVTAEIVARLTGRRPAADEVTAAVAA